MSGNLTYIIIGVIVLLIALVIFGILRRYKKCRSDEVLVVYGKTAGKTSAKCYHGGAAFVWPVIQGYAIMSMKPMQIQCDLNGALSSQKIKVNVPTVVTVAISEDPAIMQNAAVRLLGLSENEKVDQIKDVIWGQMRLVVAEMSVEQLISDRDNFLGSCRKNIEQELSKFGLALININISDITDEAEYIKNLGLEAASKAKYEALANIEKREKEGTVGIATQKKEAAIQLSEIERDKAVEVSTNEKDQAVKTTEIEKERETTTSSTRKEKDVRLREIAKEQTVAVAEQEKDEAVKTREIAKNKAIETSELDRDEKTNIAQINRDREVNIATANSEQEQRVAEQRRNKDVEVTKQQTEAESLQAALVAKKNAEIAQKNSESKIAQQKAIQDAEASSVEFEQQAQARKLTAENEAEGKIATAEQQKEAVKAEAEGKKRERTAKAQQDAKVAENNAGIGIAKSDANLGKERAEADKIIGESKANSLKAVGIADANKDAEIAKAQAAAEKEKLTATIMVGANIEADRKQVEADGYKNKVVTEATADAEAIKLKAQAEATAIKVKKLAEAEGELAMAEVLRKRIAAETANLVELKNAGMDDTAIVQWTLKEEWKNIAMADAQKFEHLNLGNVTVVGGSNSAGGFLKSIVEEVSRVSSLKDTIPGVSGIFNTLSNFDEKSQKKLEETKENGKGNEEPAPEERE